MLKSRLTYFEEMGYAHIHSTYKGRSIKSVIEKAHKQYLKKHGYEMGRIEVFEDGKKIKVFYLNGEIIEDVTKYFSQV